MYSDSGGLPTEAGQGAVRAFSRSCRALQSIGESRAGRSESDAKDEAPSKLNPDRNAVGACVRFGSRWHSQRQDATRMPIVMAELVTSDKGAADFSSDTVGFPVALVGRCRRISVGERKVLDLRSLTYNF